jgi:hypothetical protein
MVIVMVHSGETHNFMKEDIAKDIWLQLELVKNSFKEVNSGVEKVIYIAKEVSMKLKYWSGTTSFTIVPMNNFELVLGREFLRREKVVPIPPLECLDIF